MKARTEVASHADILLARHALLVGEQRLRYEPKECLRERLERKLGSESKELAAATLRSIARTQRSNTTESNSESNEPIEEI